METKAQIRRAAPPPSPRLSTVSHAVLPPGGIHILRSILDACGNLAVVTTLDPRLALVRILVAPGREEETAAVLAAERERLGLREASPHPRG